MKNEISVDGKEIKEEDWFYNTISLKPEPFKACENGDGYVNCSRYSHYRIDCKKIILTTDQDLIKDGVQPIDDEFLEWFVKNPSCEEVEVGYGWIRLTETDNEGYWVSIPNKQFEMQQEEPKQIKCYCGHTTYCDCSPLEEPKQETLEEYISKVTKNFGDEMSIKFTSGGIKLGAKWQQERMYSEEDIENIWNEFVKELPPINIGSSSDLLDYIKRFNKK